MNGESLIVTSKTTDRVWDFQPDQAKRTLLLKEMDTDFEGSEFASTEYQFILDAAEYLAVTFPGILTIEPLVRVSKRSTGMQGLGQGTPPSTVSHRFEETKERPLVEKTKERPLE